MACSFTVETIYSDQMSAMVMYMIMVCTLMAFVFGVYNVVMVFQKRGKFANLLLMLFYVFAELTLLMRLSLYVLVIIIHAIDSPPY